LVDKYFSINIKFYYNIIKSLSVTILSFNKLNYT